MKIYTEEQLQEAYNRGHMDGKLNNTDYSITDGFKPIELPSDEEIRENADKYTIDDNTYYSFINGAKWMKERYLNKTNNMKTAMQELRDDLSQIFHENQIPLKIDMSKYLEKEKEQHKETWFRSTAQFDNAAEMTYKKLFNEYYQETYNQNK